MLTVACPYRILSTAKTSPHSVLPGPARSKRGNLAHGPRPWRGVTHGPPNNATCPLGEYKTQKMMDME